MARYDDHYRRDEKPQTGGKNLKKTALTLAAGAVIALGGKELYDQHQAESENNDPKQDKVEVVAEPKAEAVKTDSDYVATPEDFATSRINNGVVIDGDVSGTTIIGDMVTNSDNVDHSFDILGNEVETVMNSDGMTIKYSDGTRVIMNSDGITTIKANGDKQIINDGKTTTIINGKSKTVKTGSGNTQTSTIINTSNKSGSKSSSSIQIGNMSVSSSNGQTTITQDGKTTTVNGSGKIAIINGQVYIDGNPINMGHDR